MNATTDELDRMFLVLVPKFLGKLHFSGEESTFLLGVILALLEV